MENLEKLSYYCFVTFANSPREFWLSYYIVGSLKSLKSLASSQFRETMPGIMLKQKIKSFHKSGQDYLLSIPAFPKQGVEVK